MKAELGFSLIEVLVALLLMSLAFLGLFAVQLKASTASQDANLRSQAVALMATQAEILRHADESARQAHAQFFGQLNRTHGTSSQMMTAYHHALNATSTNCEQVACDLSALTVHRAIKSAKNAASQGVRLNAIYANHATTLITAWGDTPASKGQDGCMRDDGRINHGASCMVMEY